MSHSTHSGFSWPRSPFRSKYPARLSLFIWDGGSVEFFASCEAVGVGRNARATAVARSSPPLLFLFLRAKSGPEGEAFGVGHRCTAPER